MTARARAHSSGRTLLTIASLPTAIASAVEPAQWGRIIVCRSSTELFRGVTRNGPMVAFLPARDAQGVPLVGALRRLRRSRAPLTIAVFVDAVADSTLLLEVMRIGADAVFCHPEEAREGLATLAAARALRRRPRP